MSELAMNDKQGEANKGAEESGQSDMHRRQRSRNIALGAVLFGMAILFYVVAIVKMSGG